MTARNEHSLGEIGRQLALEGAELAALEKHSAHLIRGIAEVGEAAPDKIAFVGGGKYARAVEASRGFAFFVDKAADAEIPAASRGEKLFVRVSDLKIAIAKVSAMFGPEEWCVNGIHPSAAVDKNAKLGQ